MTEPLSILITHVAATLALTGLIWFVQIVHYPLFSMVGEEKFGKYQEAHARLTTLVVAPLMLTELATGIALLGWRAGGFLVWLGLGLIALIWASTFLLQVPRHRRLACGFEARAHDALVKTNWIRTIAWSTRSAIVVLVLAGTLVT